MLHRLHPRKLAWALLGGSILLLSIATTIAQPPPIIRASSPPALHQIQPLLAADIIYLGERHDSTADHAAQLEILQALQARNPNLAIAMEMFQRPFQPILDQYLAGELSEAELVAQTEYEQRWGFPWEFYAPILRFARDQGLPVLALNTPSEVLRQVARQGLQSLTTEDFRYIPPLADIDTQNSDHRAWVRRVFDGHRGHNAMNFDNFFAAQVLWDETMADTIAQFRQAHPYTQIVVLAGQGHVVYGYGIPSRVERRLGPSLHQQIVLLNPTADLITEGSADLFWYSPQLP